MQQPQPEISVVIPLLNEAESLPELNDWLKRVLDKEFEAYEIIYIDDGSTDDSWKTIESFAGEDERIKGIKFRRNYGKAQALQAGFDVARGKVIITMDADLQDFPDEIPGLYRMITEQDYDLVSCHKQNRQDPVLTKNLPSKVFNWAARHVSGIQLHDFNCGLKAYKREVVKSLSLRGDIHRYIPFLAKMEGFEKIGEKPVKHQARKYGQTKFGSDRFIKGVLDLITLWFIAKFGKRPMHFFGSLGLLMFLIGGVSVMIIIGLKAYKLYYNVPAHLITDRPYFYIALASMIMGSQFFLAGFLGELIIKSGGSSQVYKISRVTKNLERGVTQK